MKDGLKLESCMSFVLKAVWRQRFMADSELLDSDLDQEIQTPSICGAVDKPSSTSDLSPGYALPCRCHSVDSQRFSAAKVVQSAAIKEGGKAETYNSNKPGERGIYP